jgi:hypothetical protein
MRPQVNSGPGLAARTPIAAKGRRLKLLTADRRL